MQADALAPALSLQALLPPLLELILRFLPLGEKVVQLSHLSSSFRPLTPACFSDDALDLTKEAVSSAVSRPSLSSLLSRVRAVSVTASCSCWSRSGRHARSTLQLPQLEISVTEFTGLRSVDMHLRVWGDSRGDLTDPLTSLSSLTQLQSLALYNVRQYHSHHDELPLVPSALLCLSQLHSLRSLTLTDLMLHPGSLLFLCSLPLEELQLSQSDFVRSAEPALPVRSPLRRQP